MLDAEFKREVDERMEEIQEQLKEKAKAEGRILTYEQMQKLLARAKRNLLAKSGIDYETYAKEEDDFYAEKARAERTEKRNQLKEKEALLHEFKMNHSPIYRKKWEEGRLEREKEEAEIERDVQEFWNSPEAQEILQAARSRQLTNETS